MKRKLIHGFMLLAAIAFTVNLAAQTATSKSNLKILFVGYDPSKPVPEPKRSYPGMMSKELFLAEYPVRMPAFKNLLSQYFAEVKTIDCRDWKPADSDPYDVTIFDFATTPIEAAKQEKDANGRTKYTPARYLPDNFSKPVVFISSTADEMGRRIGLKTDWLCLCLDADAHHLNAKHPIFKGPFEKVTPTMAVKNTPDGIFHYTTGKSVPKQIPMWRVQTVGYLEGRNDVRIGLVARGNRFLEGPDTEMISSGVCIKDVGAVALGRHGNFFHWGFGASPAQMTEEAKKVFVNAVAYIKQFDGKAPITRKYNDRMATTNDVLEIAGNASRESYEPYVKSIQEFNEANAKTKKRIDEKKAAGSALTSDEESSLQYLGNEQKIETYEAYMKRVMGKYAAQFGTDGEAFQKFIKDNIGYVYCDPTAFFDYRIDEEVKQIGISNHDIKLLDACIDMLKKNDRAELALSVLKRYTAQNFTTAKEWSTWLSKNRSKLFFSETDGYRFMVNTYN